MQIIPIYFLIRYEKRRVLFIVQYESEVFFFGKLGVEFALQTEVR